MNESQQKRAVVFILTVVLLDSIGMGMATPVMPSLIGELNGGSPGDNAHIAGWLMCCFALLQFFAAPVLGSLSDAFGRRLVLLMSLGAFGLDYVLTGMASTIAWLFAARMLAGVFCASGSVAMAYMSDISAAESKARRFGWINAAWGLGLLAGPAIGGVLGNIDTRLPFFVSAALVFLNVLFGLFALPESLARDKRRPFTLRTAGTFAALRKIWNIGAMRWLLVTYLFYQIAYSTSPSIWAFFTLERFQWTAADIGWSLALAGALAMFSQVVLVQLVVKRVGEWNASLCGLACVALTFVAVSVATSGWMLYALIVPYALGTIGMVALISTMSKMTAADAQGELNGVMTSVGSMAVVVTPVLMTYLFSEFSSRTSGVYFPGAPYLLGGILALVGFLACWLLTGSRAAQTSSP